jgi:hypothetical protein
MTITTDVQNGTYAKLGNEVGIVAALNNSNVNVTYYTSERDKYKAEFNQWSKKTAQATLEMCRVVYEAKKGLEGQDFLKFCNEIGRKGEDATVRKYIKIGEKYDSFYQYADLLPNSWTSIYEITQLPSDVFEALVATDNSMANMTGEQIKLLMGKKSEEKSVAALTTESAQSTEAALTTESTQSTEAAQTTEAAQSTEEAQSTETAQTTEAATGADESSSAQDLEFAKKATNTMLERVSSSSASVDVEEEFVPYDLVMRFNEKPSDAAVQALVEAIYEIKGKFKLNLEVKQSDVLVM